MTSRAHVHAAMNAQIYNVHDFVVDDLVAMKGQRTVSVVLPALNEQESIAEVVASIKPLVGTLVDELVVIDSGSTDNTIAVAQAAGARVYTRDAALPEVQAVAGKGEVLWRSLAVTTGDIIAFVDSDLIDPDPLFVPGLVGPLLTDTDVHLVKGFYRRPLTTAGGADPTGGGRVTELVARPLLAALKPGLREVVQPLGGEYAGTRELLAALPFAAGYGVEIGLLIDTYDRVGMSGIAQVSLGVRTHRNRPLNELGVMSRQVMGTLLRRCGIDDTGASITQFHLDTDGMLDAHSTEVDLSDRPPMDTLRPRRRHAS